MQLIDTHTHLYLEQFNDDLTELLEVARQAGITDHILPNIDCDSIEPLKRCLKTHQGLWGAMGLHPTNVKEDYLEQLDTLRKELDSEEYIAIGEVGIDLYWDQTFLRQQEEALATQIEWALERNLPVILHCRDAFPELFGVLSQYRSRPLKAVLHSFSGSKKEVAQALSIGEIYFGINGTATYKKSILPEAIPHIPLERLLIETDAPFLPPVPYRGKRNEPAMMIRTFDYLCALLERPKEELAEVLGANTARLFPKMMLKKA